MSIDDTASLGARYDTVPYDAVANPLAHPNRMAAVAMLHGMSPAGVGAARVLELGSSDGANLLPIAAAWPESHCVGCDIAASAIDAARRASGAMRLANVVWVQGDLAALPDDLGAFDYIIAHGMYSWVPEAVRDALLHVAAAHLAGDGVVFLSYNALPGCRIRQIAWDVLRMHTAHIADVQARLAAARELCVLLAEPAATQTEHDAALRTEFRRIAERTDSALFHDDLATINAPVYFSDLASHAARHGLAWLAEAKPALSSAGGLTASVRRFLAGLDRERAEQYLDFVRLRRFRQSLLVRNNARRADRPRLDRLASLHVAAATPLVRAVAEGKALTGAHESADPDERLVRRMLRYLVAIAPAAAPAAALREWLCEEARRERIVPRRAPEALMLDAALADMVDLFAEAPPLAVELPERPIADVMVRWQASRGERLTNLRHETLYIKDATARALLTLCDGTRTLAELRDGLAKATSEARAVQEVEQALQQLARHGLFRAQPSDAP